MIVNSEMVLVHYLSKKIFTDDRSCILESATETFLKKMLLNPFLIFSVICWGIRITASLECGLLEVSVDSGRRQWIAFD